MKERKQKTENRSQKQTRLPQSPMRSPFQWQTRCPFPQARTGSRAVLVPPETTRKSCKLRAALLSSVFCFLFSFPASAQKPPVVERITDRVFRVGAITVDTAARTATCPGEINMDGGAVEYLAVAPGGKLHESLLRVDARPLHLQVALLLLGLEPKNVLQAQGESKIPEGDPVEILVRWQDANGDAQEVRAESLLVSGPKNLPMPDHAWVFTGSRILKEGFEGDIAKSLVAIWHDPAALLDNPLPTGANNVWAVNPKRTPKRGTPIEFIIKALPKPEPKQQPKPAEPPKK